MAKILHQLMSVVSSHHLQSQITPGGWQDRMCKAFFLGGLEFPWNYPTQSTCTEEKLFGQRTATVPNIFIYGSLKEKGWEKKSISDSCKW